MRSEYAALFAKEIRHHHLAVIMLVLGSMMVFLFQRGILHQGGGVLSELDVVPIFAGTVLVVVALFLSYRLVVLEYYSRTQRFIEALPTSRGSLELVKFLFGLAVLLAVAFIGWVMGIFLAGVSEPMGMRFLTIMAVRLGVFTLALWSVAFIFGILGRLRIPLLVVAIIAVHLIDTLTGFERDRFGPFALIESTSFPYERSRFPVTAIMETLGVAVVVAGAAFAITLVRDGSFLESLTRTMSRRERITVLAIIGITGGAWFMNEPVPEVPPFEYQSDTVVSNGAGTVEVLYIDDIALDAANRLFGYLEPRMRGFVAATGMDERIAMRVTLSPGLEVDDFGMERIDPETGIVVHANFFHAGFVAQDLGEFAFHQLLTAVTQGRSIEEQRHWAMDGFAQYWAFHRDAALTDDDAGGGEDSIDPLLLQALVVRERLGLSAESLRDWDITALEAGELPAMAMASSGWRYLAETYGDEVVRRIARSLFAKSAKGDARDWLDALIDPVEDSFERAGVPWEPFLAGWNAWLDDHLARHAYGEAVRALIDVRTVIVPIRLANGGSGIAYSVEFAQAPDPRTECEALHIEVLPFPGTFGRDQMDEEYVPFDASAGLLSFVLDNAYGPGARVTAALDCRHPLAGKPLRHGIATFVMP